MIQPANARSILLARRLGASLEGEIAENGTRLLVYGIRRPAPGSPVGAD